MKVGIIGQGFVGNAIRQKFKEKFEIYAYDKLWDCTTHTKWSLENRLEKGTNGREVVENSDIIFVCLPTPMYEDTGKCDTSIVENAILELDKYAEEFDVNRIVIIKSTVPPGTTRKINAMCKRLKVCFSPEFLTEANAVNDFKNQDRIVIGADTEVVDVEYMFHQVFPRAKVFKMKSHEAEMVKYTANLFLATKVSFFNDIYDVCQDQGMDFSKIVDVAITDKRIGKSHYQVPGPDGDRGFGGHCFPKDTAAILHIANQSDLDIPTIRGMWETNNNVRNNKDWEKMEGRAVTKTKKKQPK